MEKFLRTLAKVTQVEWKHKASQRTTWLLAGLFFLIGWYSLDHTQLSLLSALDIAEKTAEGLGLFGGLFIAPLGSTAFRREFQSGYDFLWSRPFSTSAYVLGKFTGVYAGIITALLPIGLWTVYRESIQYGVPGVVLMLKTWGVILAPTLAVVLSVTVFHNCLVGGRFLSLLVMILVIGGILTSGTNITHLIGFAPFAIYTSPLISYGPEHQLVWLHQIFYVEISFLALVLSMIIAYFLAPRLEQQDFHIPYLVGSTLIVGAIVVVLLQTGIHFQRQGRRMSSADSTNPALGKSPSCPLQLYNIDLVINPDNGEIKGQIYLQIQDTEMDVSIPLDLNSGLHITEMQASIPGKIRIQQGMLRITLPPAYSGEISLTLKYAGVLDVPRSLYDKAFRTPQLSIAPFKVGGYVESQTIFLVRDGNWHPFPYCTPNSLRVTFPEMPFLMHTADEIESSAGQMVLTWEQAPPQPLFVSSQDYTKVSTDAVELLVAPHAISESLLEPSFSVYPVLMHRIEALLGDENSPPLAYHIAVVPLLKYGRYDPFSGTLFLPEGNNGLMTFLLSTYETVPLTSLSDPLSEPELLYRRWAAEQIMRLWWCNESICPLLQVHYKDIAFSRLLSVGDDQSQVKNPPVLNALLTYASLRLAVPLVGQEFVTAELAARQRTDLLPVLFYRVPSYNSTDNTLVVRLHKLWNQIGPEAFWRLMTIYQQEYRYTSISLQTFEDLVQRVTGEELPLYEEQK